MCRIHLAEFLQSTLTRFSGLGFFHATIIFVEPLAVAEVILAIVDALHCDVPLLAERFDDNPPTVSTNDDSLRVVWEFIWKVEINFAVLNRHNIPNFAWPQANLHVTDFTLLKIAGKSRKVMLESLR
jgi:hypothetical protein